MKKLLTLRLQKNITSIKHIQRIKEHSYKE